jgi:hypothetical protein
LYKRLPEGIKSQRLSPSFANGYPLRIAQKYKIPPSFSALASKHKSPLPQSTINTKEKRWRTHTSCKITKRGMLIAGDVDDASSCPYELITEASGTPDLSPALDPSNDLSAEPAPPFLFPPFVDSYVCGVCGRCEGE